MFGLPINEITFADVDAFCQSGVREGILLDFKKDFPAKLEKTIAAFANTYGGIVLIGVDETPSGAPALPIAGVQLKPGLRERVIQIGLDAVYPPVIPEVKIVDFKSDPSLSQSDRAVVIVRVHESETGEHAVDQRTTVYLRVENVSDPYRKATVDEREWFINKRQRALEEKDRILRLAREHARQYLQRLRTRHGMSTSEPRSKCVFWTVPKFPREPLAAPPDLLALAFSLPQHLEHHLHLFPLGGVMPVTEGLFFDGEYRSEYRYTEIQQQGLVYHEYGFWWDDRRDDWKKLVFPPSIAELMIAALNLGCRMYSNTGYHGLVDAELSLVGIRGRMFQEPSQFPAGAAYGAVDDEITVRATQTVAEWTAMGVDTVRRMMSDIAWAFGVREIPSTVKNYLKTAKI